MGTQATGNIISFVGAGEFGSANHSAALDIVFVHGLNGDSVTTWRAGDDPADFWLRWLAVDLPDVNVWSFGYQASYLASVFTGGGGSLLDNATIFRDLLLSRPTGVRPTVFISHSLGGLVVKQLLRRCSDSGNDDCKALLASTRSAVFIATPHQGAALVSSICSILSFALSKTVKELAVHESNLLDLDNWFRNWASANSIPVSAYYETRKTSGLMIVGKGTADPNIPNCVSTAVDGDHVSICKPATRQDQLYLSITAFARSLLKEESNLPALVRPPERKQLTSFTTAQGRALVPVVDWKVSGSLEPVSGRAERFGRIDTKAIGELLKLSGAPAPVLLDKPSAEITVDVPGTLKPSLLEDYQYFTTEAPHDRRALARKLADANRPHAVGEAERKKERFHKSLLRHAAQASALGRYTRLMADVVQRFDLHVLPLIEGGADELSVNQQVQKAVIDPVYQTQLSETEDVTSAVVESALFYLTGNCHVRWDPTKV